MLLNEQDTTPDNDGYIPGIFNYCDRWCERCTKTSRCRSFALEQRLRSGKKSSDETNELFWEYIDSSVPDGLEFLIDDDDEDGDFEFTGYGPELDDKLNMLNAENHPCAVIASGYARIATRWFESTDRFGEFYPDDEDTPQTGAPAPDTDAARLKDAFDIIHWYKDFIYVKLIRAISGISEDELEGDNDHSDALGSTKVALIGIDRSIGAWGIMLKAVPEQKEAIIRIIASLAGLRRRVEETFPSARDFIRPGLDTDS